MKAISIRQPYASAIASDHPLAKRVENRGRRCTYRGPLAIHASLTADVAADHDWRILRVRGDDPRLHAPVGAVIAVADLVDCHEATLARDLLAEACCAPWGERHYRGRPAWHLVLANVRVLDRPVSAKGQLAVPWTLPNDVAEQVHQQIGATA